MITVGSDPHRFATLKRSTVPRGESQSAAASDFPGEGYLSNDYRWPRKTYSLVMVLRTITTEDFLLIGCLCCPGDPRHRLMYNNVPVTFLLLHCHYFALHC